ncbi:ribosome biogenesis protein SPATA5L1-like isoform X2 [Dreissena polymorpha]|uniref:ribosome biogenesis protein SPATA5L1-like isoform X2 n=1 Tax=Dreissena polymorpha TaxID=45954 RepID=UPI002264DDB8|nr:ribosome biogenesis protein SPATA5L1-like isoform X2 [Dreissena polymorpha]
MKLIQFVQDVGFPQVPMHLEPPRSSLTSWMVLISPPDLHQRLEILHMNVTSFPVVGDLDLAAIATITNGYVGADLKALCQEASYLAMAECKDSGENVLINQEHFIRASRQIRPSLQKGAEGVVDVRPVSWGDIGGLHEVKRQLQQAVEWPLKHPEAFKRMGLSPPRGVLLYGPPGCCKTTLVRAAATSCHVTFLSISGAQLYSPYVGDSERLISEVFHKARACAPSILFLDEIDSIIGKRSETGNHGVGERILSALLNEMDGIGVRLGEASGSAKQKLLEGSSQGFIEKSQTTEEADNKQVLVVAASNRPDMLDEALMRPGRMDRVIYVGPPDVVARHQILSVYTRGWGLSDVTLGQLAQETDMYTGADLESLCREAALCALTENLEAAAVSHDHFRRALTSVRPSLTQEIICQYTSLAFHAVR